MCGAPTSSHDVKQYSNQDRWTVETCTQRVPTKTYGEIEFADNPSARKPVRYFGSFCLRLAGQI